MNDPVVIREDALRRTTWRFFYYRNEHTLRLNYYTVEERPTTRHKFRVVVEYQSHNRHYSGVPDMPDDVRAEAHDLFVRGLTVTTWPDTVRA